jgi:hypothetical protein
VIDDYDLPLIEQFRLAGEEWVDLDAAARMLEETKTSIMAQKQSALGDISVNKAEQTVKASAEWIDHLRKIVDAKTAANKARLKLKYLEMRYYEVQGRDANRRAEIKMLGGST